MTIETLRVMTKVDFMTYYLDKLREFESLTLEDYLSDYNKQLVIERFL